MFSEKHYDVPYKNLPNYTNLIYNCFQTTTLSKKIYHNNFLLCLIITKEKIDDMIYSDITFEKSIQLASKYYVVVKLNLNCKNGTITNKILSSNTSLWCIIYESDDKLKMNIYIDAKLYGEMTEYIRLNIYKLTYDLSNMVKTKYNLNSLCFGYYYHINYYEKKSIAYNYNKYVGYLQQTAHKKFSQKMQLYSTNDILRIGIIIHFNVIPMVMSRYVCQNVHNLTIYYPENIQERTSKRIKYSFYLNYLFNNNELPNDVYNKQKKIACGLRYKPEIQMIPQFLQQLQNYLTTDLHIINKLVNQISIIHYFNNTNLTEEIYASIGPHYEDDMFDYVVAVYLGKPSSLSINLKYNTSNGDFSVELPVNSVIEFKSYKSIHFSIIFMFCKIIL